MSRLIERIGFITPTKTKDYIEWIVVGERFRDLGVCIKILDYDDKAYVAHFLDNDKPYFYKVLDVKRIIETDGSKSNI